MGRGRNRCHVASVLVSIARTRVVALTLLALTAGGVFASSASAREYCTTGIVRGWCKNPDGTYSFRVPHQKDTSPPAKVYSASEYEKFGKLAVAVGIESNGASNKVTELGFTGGLSLLPGHIVTELRKWGRYATPQEAEYGRDFAQTAREIGELPDAGEALSEGIGGASAGGITLLGGIAGAAAVGVAIGTGVDYLFGMPTFFGDTNEVKHEASCGGSLEEKCKINEKWGAPAKLGKAEKCSTLAAEAPPFASTAIMEGPSGSWCNTARRPYKETETAVCLGFCEHEKGEIITRERNLLAGGWSTSAPLNCPESLGPLSCIFQLEEGTKFHNGLLFVNATKRSREEMAYPGPGKLKEDEGIGVEEPPGKLSTTFTPPKPSEITAPAPNEVAQPQTTVEASKGEEEQEDEEGNKVPAPLPGIEGDELPKPEQEEIPVPRHNESWPEYKEELEQRQFATIVEIVLTPINEDPTEGPDDVTTVSPAAGSFALPSTTIRVDVNPEDAPAPGGTGGISGPTEPGIHFPKLGIACTSFPFGVPCWIYNEFHSWSAVGSPPVLKSAAFTIKGTTIPAASFDLAPLEPLMEKIRPFMIIFATIGLVIAFYRWTTGKNVGTTGDTTGDADHLDDQGD